MPRLVKSVEAAGKNLEDIAKKLDFQCGPVKDADPGLFDWAAYSIGNSMLEMAENLSIDDEEDVFAQMIMEEMCSDTDRETTKLLHAYRMSSPESRKVIDAVFVFMTGWSLATLIKRYVERKKQKTEGAWRTHDGFLAVQRNTEKKWDYTLYTPDYKLLDGGRIDDPDITITEVRDQILSDAGWSGLDVKEVDYELLETVVNN